MLTTVVDLVVAEISDGTAIVAPSQLVADYVDPQIIGFTVTNQGNENQDFALEVQNLADGAAIPYTVPVNDSNSANNDPAAFSLYEDDGDGIFNGADTLLAAVNPHLDNMGEDETRTVWVVADIPAAAANGDIIGVFLRATTHDDDGAATLGPLTNATVGGDTAGVDVVFGDDDPVVTATDDGARDGQHSDRDAFEVQNTILDITKSSTVNEDPFNGLVNPHAIPGAYVEYEITVTNPSATVTAFNVSVSDDFTAEFGGATPTLAFANDRYGAGPGDDIELDHSVNGVSILSADNADGDGDGGELTGDILTVSGFDLPPLATATISFMVQIQ